ncbi:MAG: 3-hydroxyacyl-CoA dehydrogenase NAD-binding domain-containing protein, partial [Ignavibacteriales bacterium]
MNINDIKRIACLGGGIIGSSWATAFVFNGYDVNIYFPLSDEIAECDQTIRNNLQTFAKYNVIAEDMVETLMKRVTYTTDLKSAVSDVQYIQENAPEDLDLKRELLRIVDLHSPAETIFATSSSFLLISEIARGS